MNEKIKVIILACFLFVAGGLLVGSPNSTNAQGSGCPNGCMGPGDHCFCHIWHFGFKEYTPTEP